VAVHSIDDIKYCRKHFLGKKVIKWLFRTQSSGGTHTFPDLCALRTTQHGEKREMSDERWGGSLRGVTEGREMVMKVSARVGRLKAV
jgi:hypothetical protein